MTRSFQTIFLEKEKIKIIDDKKNIQNIFLQKCTYLPSFESHTWMKTGIIEHTWIHKRHAEVRHP